MELKHITSELADHPKGTFLDIAKFNGHQVGACDITGTSPVWEMHPDTDELFYIVDGEIELTLLEAEGSRHYTAGAGSIMVVPQGVWHKPAAPAGARFLYLTPGQTLHSDADDPRGTEV